MFIETAFFFNVFGELEHRLAFGDVPCLLTSKRGFVGQSGHLSARVTGRVALELTLSCVCAMGSQITTWVSVFLSLFFFLYFPFNPTLKANPLLSSDEPFLLVI